MRKALLLVCAALSGCSGAAENKAALPPEPETNAIAAQPPRPTAPAPLPPLTAEGWGPLRIGMSAAEVAAAMGGDANPAETGGPDPESCDLWRPARAPEGLLVMIESGRLTSIWLIDNAPVATDRGLRVGARPGAVRRTHGSAVQSARHEYEDPPAEYLTVWTRGAPRDASQGTRDPNARGITYEVDGTGVVRRIAAGGPSIQYVEGCA